MASPDVILRSRVFDGLTATEREACVDRRVEADVEAGAYAGAAG